MMLASSYAKGITNRFLRNPRWTSGVFLLHIQAPNYSVYAKQRPFVQVPNESASFDLFQASRQSVFEYTRRYMSNSTVELRTDDNVVRFSFNNVTENRSVPMRTEKKWKRAKSSRKAKVNELRFYRLKAKKKMNSPNPEVRIRYKLEKAKRKEEWLLEKLRKYDVPKSPAEPYDPETLTEEEQHYLKRTGEKRKNFVLVGRRGVFGGVVLNMHLHWKKHETVKVICKPCNKPGQIHEYAEELARLSKGIVIDVKPHNTIVLYRGKNYVRPQVMSPVDTLSKDKALEKYRYEQSLEHTSEFIEKLENELEEYQKYVARYKKKKDDETEKKKDADSKSKAV
uniref:Putative CRM domain-containing protein, chloroplastic n=1 Tax=Noccaea caerulescens TaxID=107243 RepID=A0A1J3IV91_NOCCA